MPPLRYGSEIHISFYVKNICCEKKWGGGRCHLPRYCILNYKKKYLYRGTDINNNTETIRILKNSVLNIKYIFAVLLWRCLIILSTSHFKTYRLYKGSGVFFKKIILWQNQIDFIRCAFFLFSLFKNYGVSYISPISRSQQKHHVQLIVSLIKLICFGIYKQFSQDRHTSHQEIGPRAELTRLTRNWSQSCFVTKPWPDPASTNNADIIGIIMPYWFLI